MHTRNRVDEAAGGLVDDVSAAAEQAVNASRRKALEALDSVAGAVDDLRRHTLPAIDRAGDRLSAATHDGMAAVADRAQRVGEVARRAGGDTVRFIQREPVKSVVGAALAGAALMAVLGMLAGRRGDGR